MPSIKKFLESSAKKAALAAFLAVLACTSAWFGYAYWKEVTSPHFLFSAFHTLYGDFS